MTLGESAYLAIDIGGSKTLLAAFSPSGQILHQSQFPTPSDYQKFLKVVSTNVKEGFDDWRFTICCCGVPAKVNRQRGIGEVFGNLKWKNVPIKSDLQRRLGIAVLIENDANLAGLSEALLVHKKYKRVLYLTLSTGIGDGIIINGKIDPTLADSEAGHMLLEHRGKIAPWEDFASGRALKERYGKLAQDIDDPLIWDAFAKDVAAGLNELIPVIRPEVIIIGGSLGTYFEKFAEPLHRELTNHPNKMIETPPIIKAKKSQEAVIYGCYEYIKQNA